MDSKFFNYIFMSEVLEGQVVDKEAKLQEATQVLQQALVEEQKELLAEMQKVLDAHPKFALQISQTISVVPKV